MHDSAEPSNRPGASLNLARLVRVLLPEILNAATFQLSQQLLAWRLRDAFEADGVYVLQLTPCSELVMHAQAGAPPQGQGFGALMEALSTQDGRSLRKITYAGEGGEERTVTLAHFACELAGDHNLVLALVKDAFADEEVAGLKYLASVVAPALSSVLKRERVAAELIETRRLVQDSKAEQRAKNAFLARMSHDLRTPLSVVLGFAQLLEMEDLSKGQHEHVQYILKSGKQLLSLINQVLELTELDSGKVTLQLQPLQVSAVIAKCVDAMLPKARENQVKISIEDAGSDLWVLADPPRLEQILYNLLSNGIKFNTKNGVVVISAGAMEGNSVRIQVRDTGPGVPKLQIPRLFEPFDRLNARSEVEGSGLGLAVSQALARALGGSLGAQSQMGRGSAFTLDLPAAKKPSASHEVGGEP